MSSVLTMVSAEAVTINTHVTASANTVLASAIDPRHRLDIACAEVSVVIPVTVAVVHHRLRVIPRDVPVSFLAGDVLRASLRDIVACRFVREADRMAELVNGRCPEAEVGLLLASLAPAFERRIEHHATRPLIEIQ